MNRAQQICGKILTEFDQKGETIGLIVSKVCKQLYSKKWESFVLGESLNPGSNFSICTAEASTACIQAKNSLRGDRGTTITFLLTPSCHSSVHQVVALM